MGQSKYFYGVLFGPKWKGWFPFELYGEFFAPFELTKLAKFLLIMSLNVQFQQLDFVVFFQGDVTFGPGRYLRTFRVKWHNE